MWNVDSKRRAWDINVSLEKEGEKLKLGEDGTL